MRSVTVTIRYPGSVISCNHYKYKGGIYTKPEAKAFMDELGWLLKTSHIEGWNLPISVTCSGKFKDKRSQPDLHNLLKVICDSIEDVTGINDKYYHTSTGESIIDKTKEPTLFITIEEVAEGNLI